MPSKIGFTVISSTGEDERYRATELNYHGPTVRGWRSAMNCAYPQEITIQLNVAAILHRIQILSHQYLIPQKIEIWTSEGLDYDPSLSPGAVQSFEYLGFITLSDNQSTGFKSRELKSIAVPPTTARYIKLRLHSNHANEKNTRNQVGIIAVNVLGDEVPELNAGGDEVNNNGNCYSIQQCESTLISNPQYVSPYDDLAFEMYVDKDVARIMRLMESKKHQAVLEERFEYAGKLKMALEDLRGVGETLGKFEQEKRQAINTEDYDKAKLKKLQIDQYREKVYRVLRVDELLEPDGPLEENDLNSSSLINKTLRKQELEPPTIHSLAMEQSANLQKEALSPNQENHQGNKEEKYGWDYLQPQAFCKNTNQFSRPQSPNALIHSRSQTSFEQYANPDDSPPPQSGPYFSFPISSSNPQLIQYPASLTYPQAFSAAKFPTATSLYNCQSLQPVHQLPPLQHSSEMYHSLPPTTQVADHKMQSLPIAHATNAAEFPLPQRNYSDGEIKFQCGSGQKTVDFDSPVAQAMETPKARESEAKAHGKGEPACPKTPADSSNASKSPPAITAQRSNSLRGSLRRSNKSAGALSMKSSYEAYEERMLPALKHYHGNEIVRECQLGLVEPMKKSRLNEREKKQAALPISVFGIDLVEKFYSKHFADKEEGLKQLQDELKREVDSSKQEAEGVAHHSPNKIARATIFLLHRALRDKVYSVYSSAAVTIRLFFSEYVPNRVSPAEVARSVERLLPELIAKSGDATPRIHNMAAHTLLSMADCKEVRELHIIPVHLSRPLTSSVHPRLALSRLEMIEQLILNQGISTEKQSGLTCRTLAEFGSSGLHHPAEAVRKVSERILIQVYRVNPRLVRKQLPPDDDITRRNLLYRQLFQEFDFMDMQRKREMYERRTDLSSSASRDALDKPVHPNWDNYCKEDAHEKEMRANKANREGAAPTQQPKRTVNQQTSPTKPFCTSVCSNPRKEKPPAGILRDGSSARDAPSKNPKSSSPPKENKSTSYPCSIEQKASSQVDDRKGMLSIAEEEKIDSGLKEQGAGPEDKDLVKNHDVTLKFSNLVDSLRVTEDRLTFAPKGMRNLKSLKYIFPTTYIGNSTSSQATVNTSNSVNSFCNMIKKQEPSAVKAQATSHSGIPVPTNGRYHNLLTPVAATKKSVEDLKPENEPEMATMGKAEENAREGSKQAGSLVRPLPAENPPSDTDPKASEHQEEKSSKEEFRHAEVVASSTNANDNAGRTKSRELRQTFKMCIFCFASENWYTEESLNLHYWMSCPMLTRCAHCREVVEISGLIQHRLEDCEYRHLFRKCEICQEAIPKDLISRHECIASESKSHRNRCPLCHSDVGNDDDWRQHLMGPNVCPNHPRKTEQDENEQERFSKSAG